MGLMDGAPMFHWHYDTFDLPKLPPPPGAPPTATSSALLCSSAVCKNQAFRLKNRLFGFQFHFEFTENDIEAVLTAGKRDVQKVLGPDGETKISRDTARYYPLHARLGERVLRNFVQFLKLY